LLRVPFCVTQALPGFVPAATVATTCVSLQLTTVPAVLLKPTLPLPCVAPNPDPVNVTCIPGVSAVGEMLVNVGAAKTD
jgi:hypothetical protein